MRFKLDENLPLEAALILRQAGYDAQTTHEEGLNGSPDTTILAACKSEARVLLTLDLDFCNILDYPPAEFAGIIVFRNVDQSKNAVLWFLENLLIPTLQSGLDCAGHLLILQKNGMRIR